MTVEKATLDSLTKDINRPISFIKCDAEFHELACLHGARQTIDKWHPTWLIETLDDSYKKTSDGEEIASFLRGFGYSAFILDGKDFRARQHGEKSQNTFFFAGAANGAAACAPLSLDSTAGPRT